MINAVPVPAAPGKRWYVAAGAIVVVTMVAIIALIAWFVLTLDQGVQFIGPGRHTATFDKPGTYLVWNDYRTVFNGRGYEESEKLPPGVQVKVIEVDGGQALTVSASINTSSNLGDTTRNSVAKFEITRPGRYEIIIEGDFPARVFSASKEFLLGLLAMIFGAIALLFLGFGAAIGLVCWVFIKREQARAAAAPVNVAKGVPPNADAAAKLLKDISRSRAC